MSEGESFRWAGLRGSKSPSERVNLLQVEMKNELN